MLRVGLTGGISAGKSTVGRLFVELGWDLLDADAVVHRLFEPGQAVNRAVSEAFGARVIAPDGSINRKVLGEIVFGNPQELQRLNALVHPAVVGRQEEWLHALGVKDPGAIGIVEAALMIEAGIYKRFDKLIVVTCSLEEQRRRLKERSNLPDEQIEARIRAQMPMDEKAKYADYVIENSGTIDATRKRVREVWEELKILAAP